MSADDSIILLSGDCLEKLSNFPDASVDAVVTDPPYGLDFMGKHWDTGAVAFDVAVWSQCFRILKPGGHLLSFGGSRTWHRLVCVIEDAGFDIRDSIAWLYGSGFPKSMDVSKAIDKAAGAERKVISEGSPVRRMIPGADQNRTGSWIKDNGRVFVPTETAPATDAAKQWQGWGTALKPAFEPIVVARKPLSGTVAANVLEHGTGALNIDACRVAMQEGQQNPSIARRKGATNHLSTEKASVTEAKGRLVSRASAETYSSDHPGEALGRWPANVLLDDSQAEALDAQTAPTKSSGGKGEKSGKLAQNDYAGTTEGANAGGLGDESGVSRYFPTFKYQAKASKKERPVVDGVAHPTVKPLDLMRWLVKLVTPPGGVVLDPFAGSGTTVEACVLEGMCCIAIEREDEYLALIRQRIERVS